MMTRVLITVTVVFILYLSVWIVKAAEPTLELTARCILEVVKAFRTACVLEVVEQARDSGIRPNEEWQTDSHFIPLPAQFVKAVPINCITSKSVCRVHAGHRPAGSMEKLNPPSTTPPPWVRDFLT